MLLRFDPFQTFDRLSRELLSYPGWTGGGSGWMPMDAWRRGDVVEVAFDGHGRQITAGSSRKTTAA